VGCGRFRPGTQSSVGSHRAIASEAQPRPDADGGLSRPVTRRNFIVWYLAGLLTATVLAIVAPILVFIFPPEGQTKREYLAVQLDKPLTAMENGSATQFKAPAQKGFVMKDGGGDNAPGKIAFAGYTVKDLQGQIRVFAVNCSHLGCSVAFKDDAKRFDCPCHGSQFNIDGGVVHGPALFALSNLDWKEAGPNQIQVLALSLPGVG
jgi:Rieske Fe-S protein